MISYITTALEHERNINKSYHGGGGGGFVIIALIKNMAGRWCIKLNEIYFVSKLAQLKMQIYV